jgi:radical SAM superfamily enzyme YgiQ (UPF0313 family)/CDGSH-type Zn-finger protein
MQENSDFKKIQNYSDNNDNKIVAKTRRNRMNHKKKICTCGKSKNPPYCDHSHDMIKVCPHAAVSHQATIPISPLPNKILLIMLPYWDPLIPPQGISHLKHFLQHHGYIVKTDDINTKKEFKLIYNNYFDVIRKYVPAAKQGNLFNIGQDVMRNHMIAHIHYKNETDYSELVKEIIYQTFFTRFNHQQAIELKKVLDEFYQLLQDYMLHLLISEKPGVLGLTVLRDTIGPAIFAFKLTKEKYPFIKTVMGGSVFSDHLLPGTPNFEYFLEQTPFIDKIIIGEGQNLFLKLLKGELPEEQRVFTIRDIGGETLGPSPLNFPDMTDFNVSEEYPYIAAQVSFSCPYQCSFCNVKPYFGKYREKEPAQAFQEMKALYQKYGVQLFFMNDALLNRVATGLSEEMIDSDLAFYWDGYLRVDETVCDPEITLQWRRGGFYRARLGIESGSQRVLDMIHKGITTDQIKRTLISLAAAGIKTTAYWVIGHPGETDEDFLQTLLLLEETKDYIYEAECNSFIFGFAGQGDSETWKHKRKLLFPGNAKEMLIVQSWILDDLPSREETYERMNRFVQLCSKLGIPNPYSILDIHKADLRWKKLHRNAVPCLVDFKGTGAYIDECKSVKQLLLIQEKIEDQGDFGFENYQEIEK